MPREVVCFRLPVARAVVYIPMYTARVAGEIDARGGGVYNRLQRAEEPRDYY